MACKGCLEWLLKLLNFLVTLSGLAVVVYGIHLLVEWNRATSGAVGGGRHGSAELLTLGRPMLLVATLSESFLDNLPSGWFIYLFVGFGAVIFLISCVGCIGATTKNGYAFLLFLLILVELGCAAFILFDSDWKKLIVADKTGDLDKIYEFLKENWKIAKWVAVGGVVLEAFALFLSLKVRATNNRPTDYNRDEEYIATGHHIRQPLINREDVTATGIPVASTLDRRPSRNDSWSRRMRQKYGFDTSELAYNPSDPSGFQQPTAPPLEERRRCAIL